jgi:hypothetical protein
LFDEQYEAINEVIRFPIPELTRLISFNDRLIGHLGEWEGIENEFAAATE